MTKRDPGPRLVDVYPECAAALDKFEVEPTEENWSAAVKAARDFRAKVRPLERIHA